MKRTFCLLATMAFFAIPETVLASASPVPGVVVRLGSDSPRPEPKRLPKRHRGPSLIQRIRLDYIESYIEEAATKERLEPALLRAVIRVESNFNHKARSRVGARGLMQIMPFTAAELGNKKALDHRNPRANIMAGSHYLRELINQFGGDLRLALAAYNAGPRAVEKYHGVPPYSETRGYVRKILDQLDDERNFVADAVANGD